MAERLMCTIANIRTREIDGDSLGYKVVTAGYSFHQFESN